MEADSQIEEKEAGGWLYTEQGQTVQNEFPIFYRANP